MLVQLLFLIHLALVLGQLGQFDCPPPWIGLEESCYRFETFPNTIDGAEAACETDGGSLVSVTDRLEHNFIVEELERNPLESRMWFTSGRRDSEDRTKYMWEGDGQQVIGSQFWLSDDSRKSDGDIIVYQTNGAKWGWSLIAADTSQPFICEINRAEIYKIVQEVRGFDYGIAETDPAVLERGPKFTTQPVNAIFDPETGYTSVSFECVAVSNPQPTYEWILDKEQNRAPIDLFVEPRFSITGGRLVINEPSERTDNGNYQCVASNKFGSVLSNTVQLSFGYLLDFPKSIRDPVRVDAFSGVGIECNPPKHYPDILYSWYKDDIRNFIRSSLKPYVFVSANGKLYFSSVTKDDEGDYHCLVFSPQAGITSSEGKTSMPIPLVVRESVASIREPQIASGFPAVYPSSPKQGDRVKIECFAWGTGDLSYNWQKQDGALPGHHTIEDNGRVLVIPQVEIIHGGTYICTVTRLNGQNNVGFVQLPVDAEPFFTIPLRDQHVDEGADITWRCIANGIPSVSYRWYRNAEPLNVEDLPGDDMVRYTINNNVLMIKQVKAGDSGMYQCAATNLHATHYSTAQLRVLSFAPNFYKQPLQVNTYATTGGNVTIVCQPEAAPRAEIVWKKDKRNLVSRDQASSDSRIELLPNGNLHISRLRRRDEGTYTCEATNDLGSVESTGNLSVIDTMRISRRPLNTVVLVNHTAFFHCEASYNTQQDLTYIWYHNTRLIEFIKIKNLGNQIYVERDPHFYRGTGINRGGLFIRNTQFYHAGRYKCLAKTTSGSVQANATLDVEGPPAEPAGVIGFNADATSISLKWTKGSDHGRSTTGYVVEGFNQLEGFWRQIKSNIRGNDAKNQETRIEGLSPWSAYTFRVRAENALGLGNPSDPSPVYTTLEAKPLVAPQNVGGGGGKVGVLTVTWEPLAPADQNGEGIGYRVLWKKKNIAEKDNWDQQELMGPDRNRYVHMLGITYFYSEYDVSVQAFNNKGDGPMSSVVTIRSAEDLPTGVPTKVRCSPFNSTAMTITWEPVADTIETMKGKLLGYRLNYWKEEGEDETMAQYRPIPGQTDRGLIIGLEAHTYYYVNVQVYNTAGNGPKSQEYLEETLRLAPRSMPKEVVVTVMDGQEVEASWRGIQTEFHEEPLLGYKEAPTETYVKVINDEEVEVNWRGVSTDQTEEPLQGYKVRYWLQGENIYAAQDLDAEKKTRIRIKNLMPNQVYNLRVLGYSRGGDGLMSSPTVQFVLGPKCKVIETGQDFRFIYTCGACGVQLSFVLVAVLSVYQSLVPWL